MRWHNHKISNQKRTETLTPFHEVTLQGKCLHFVTVSHHLFDTLILHPATETSMFTHSLMVKFQTLTLLKSTLDVKNNAKGLEMWRSWLKS